VCRKPFRIEFSKVERLRRGNSSVLVVETRCCGEKTVGDGAIGQAGVDMAKAEMPGEPTRQGALAARRWPVDGDDDRT